MEFSIQGRKGLLGKMVSNRQSADVTLRQNDIFELNGDRNKAHIQCLDGTLWITQINDLEDHFIKKGQTFNITNIGKVIIQGLPCAKARVYLQ